jgi:membrane-associated phospholipid phosphatase
VEATQGFQSATDRAGDPAARLYVVWSIVVGISLAAVPGLILVDDMLMAILRTHQPPILVAFMRRMTWLGYGAVDIGVLVSLAAYGWWVENPGLKVRGLAGAVMVAGAGLLDQVVKNVACRARPSAPRAGSFFCNFPCFPASYSYASFPSGHATTAFATALILAFWYPRQTGLFLGLAVLVGLSRVVLGAHFPSDVMAGAVLGTGIALVVHAYVPQVRLRSEKAAIVDTVSG